MAWVKVHDDLYSHPKILAARDANPASLGLYLLALSYTARYLTDGDVSEQVVRTLMPRRAQREKAVATLVDAGLWEPNGTGWQFHHYTDWNRSRAEVEAQRAAGRIGAEIRWGR